MDLHKYPLSGPFIDALDGTSRKLNINRPYMIACRRAVAYKASRVIRSDPVPWQAEAEAQTSKVLVPVILRAMTTTGWTVQTVTPATKTQQHYSQWRPHPVVSLNALPDAFGSHPEQTSGYTTTILTAWRATPDAPLPAREPLLLQMTSFLKAYAKQHTVHPDAPAILAILTMDPYAIEVVPIRPRDIKRQVADFQGHFQPLADFAVATDQSEPLTVPPRDYDLSSPECSACPWRSACHQDV